MSFVVSGAILGSGFIEVMLKKQEKKSEQAMEESIQTSLTRAFSSSAFTGTLGANRERLNCASDANVFAICVHREKTWNRQGQHIRFQFRRQRYQRLTSPLRFRPLPFQSYAFKNKSTGSLPRRLVTSC